MGGYFLTNTNALAREDIGRFDDTRPGITRSEELLYLFHRRFEPSRNSCLSSREFVFSMGVLVILAVTR